MLRDNESGIFGALPQAAPDPVATREQFWVILRDSTARTPRIREIEAVRCDAGDPDGKYWCRVVNTSTWFKFDRDQLYDDQETAELEAAEALFSGEF